MKAARLTFCILAGASSLWMSPANSDEPRESATTSIERMPGKKAGDVREDNELKMKLVWCPAGKFTMGSPVTEIGVVGIHGENENQVSVALTKGFWLGKFEVTQREYERIMGENPSAFSATGKYSDIVSGIETHQFPVEYVSYEDSLAFCRKLTDQERRAARLPADWEYTLPTEAQWEFACRAGTTTPFSSGNKLTIKDANCGGDESDFDSTLHRTAAVGSYAENPWGLCDMHGNVFEWCRDFYIAKLPGGTDPEFTKASELVTSRGGAWNYYSAACRSAARRRETPALLIDNHGFRVALGSARQGKAAGPRPQASQSIDK